MPIVGDSVREARVLDRDQLAVKQVLFSHLDYFADGFGAMLRRCPLTFPGAALQVLAVPYAGVLATFCQARTRQIAERGGDDTKSTKVDRSAATAVVGCQRPARCRATSVAMSCDDTATRPSLWLVTYKHAAATLLRRGPDQRSRGGVLDLLEHVVLLDVRVGHDPHGADRGIGEQPIPRHRAGQSRVNRNAISGWRCRRVSFMLHLPGWRAASGQ